MNLLNLQTLLYKINWEKKVQTLSTDSGVPRGFRTRPLVTSEQRRIVANIPRGGIPVV